MVRYGILKSIKSERVLIMKKSKFIIFNLIFFIIFSCMLYYSLRMLNFDRFNTITIADVYHNFLLGLISGGGLLIQFYFINKKLSE